MRKNRRTHTAFRPELTAAGLEQRLVLSVPPGFAFVSPRQALQLRAAYNRVLRSQEFIVRTEIQAQARQLFASRTPTAQQIADFDANADGAIVAGSVAVASALALLPGSQHRLVPSTARALLASNESSLISRVNNIVTNSSNMSSLPTLQTTLKQTVRNSFGNVRTQAAQFLANTNLNRAVLNATDGSQSLSQFIGDRIISQFSNNLGNLALAFPTVANSVLFAGGATTASPAAVQQFNQLATPALELTALSLGTELQLLPNATTVMPALQNALFGSTTSTTGTTGTTGTTSTTPINLFDALQALPTTSTDFATAVPSMFTTAFSTLTGVLSPFVGTFPSPTFTLPTTTTAGVFSPTFTGTPFQSGFLGGFGSGFPGFGVAPTTLNTNFGTGFNNIVTTSSPIVGFKFPTFLLKTGVASTGVVGTVGLTTGTGAATGPGTGTTTGTGTSGGTTGTGTI